MTDKRRCCMLFSQTGFAKASRLVALSLKMFATERFNRYQIQ